LGAIRRAKLQSNRHHRQTNAQHFYRLDALPVTQPTSVTALKDTPLSICLSLSDLTAIFPGEPGLNGFIGAKDDGGGGDNWSHKSCKAPVKSQIVAPTIKPFRTITQY